MKRIIEVDLMAFFQSRFARTACEHAAALTADGRTTKREIQLDTPF